MLTVAREDSGGGAEDAAAGVGSSSLIDQIVRDGARRMLAAALQAEVEDYIAAFADQRDEAGRRLVVRNGYHQPRQVGDQRRGGGGARPAGQRPPSR